MCEGLHRSIDMLQWCLEANNNKLLSILGKQDACAKSLKQLEDALAEVPSTDEEMEMFTKEKKAESSKWGTSQASSSKEENKEEEDELISSSSMLAKGKGKGHTK